MKLLHLSLFALTLAAPNVYALSSDSEQPVYIDSDSQQLDMKSNQVTFLGDVNLKQGSININADKVIVTRNAVNGEIEEIQGYGKPATFSQLTDDGKTLYGEADDLHYQLIADKLIMTKNAMLSQDGSIIRGSKITYQIASQKLVADSDSSERVSTVLQPAEVNK
ncbi:MULTISPECIES: lipopolysaccharide transport periplasmic protein LptA [Vibrio]|jgi:lipopolysaccharide export system protein LptA|uniref:Lipopolysaccharide export system protein LptA n=3 Tax=Vibrio cyclitrophicus TaxID=47951 RepID=A0A7Z1S1I2_9VIBR|nr:MULTISPECIES: lipopolysaccharide transport periplasmic protein LptA [Vibrio]KNH10791.1 ABC transporter substrate-binding protein [Vibrio lentus]MBY7661798.1 lipopolysaccharide transport periplasmic protein LptA [Vibrio atlanticus]ERM58736.1 LptA, protein essential for LPS transport across the periplasm [Vibrio cyclitrophicus FF75]KAA8596333.1 Lipopolysaccharide export system protein LptA [Vibrio cyclitrophicus]MBE8555437.1 lipopolysaccharide transport periplasmic protein LptA [Vibrio sp. OP